MTYAEMEASLFARARGGMKLGLDRMERALDALGRPERAAPAFHVAGTNGKGSTCAFIATACRAAGLRTGLYTSPHLEHFSERFQVNGIPAEERILLEHYRELEERVPWAFEGPDSLTFFELVTLLAFQYFAREHVEVMVVEVGLGGRLDATNVLRPLVTCITPIGLEHREFLGDTLAQIAGEKAGILKAGVPAVVAAQEPEALDAIARRAAEVGAPLEVEGRDFTLTPSEGELAYHSRHCDLAHLTLGLRGAHQRSNAAIALRAVELASEQGLALGPAHARAGLARAEWPGRLETVLAQPLVVLDGAHNPPAAQALAAAVRELFPGRRVHLVLAVLADKEPVPILEALAPQAATVTTTAPATPRALSAGALATLAAAHHPHVRAVDGVGAAVDAAIAQAGPDDVVLVCGSLYLVGEARAHLRGGRAGGPREILR